MSNWAGIPDDSRVDEQLASYEEQVERTGYEAGKPPGGWTGRPAGKPTDKGSWHVREDYEIQGPVLRGMRGIRKLYFPLNTPEIAREAPHSSGTGTGS